MTKITGTLSTDLSTFISFISIRNTKFAVRYELRPKKQLMIYIQQATNTVFSMRYEIRSSDYDRHVCDNV